MSTTAPTSHYFEDTPGLRGSASGLAHEFKIANPIPPAFRFIGRCKLCKIVHVEEITTRWVTKHDRYGGVALLRESAGTERTFFCHCTGLPKGNRVALRLVKGTYNKDTACDARCLNARGPSCECSCGGDNHGAGHVPVTA